MNIPLVAADQGFSSLARQMGRWIEQVLGSDYRRYGADRAWRPPINLYEDEESFYLVADLGGVDPESVDLHVEGGKLLLRGQRHPPRPPGQKTCPPARPPLRMRLMEINHGPFLRTLQLPESVDASRICACYKSGFLWAKMPKRGPGAR